MTTLQIARILKGRRYAKGKWMAKCPVHREKTGSLSISEMPGGNTRIHCFAGCTQKSILDVLGLSWKDLKAHQDADPEILKQIREQEARFEQEQKERRSLTGLALDKASLWSAVSEGIGRLLASFPHDDRLAVLFHQSLAYQRRFESIADCFDFPCCEGMGSARRPRRKPLLASEVTPEIATRLGLNR